MACSSCGLWTTDENRARIVSLLSCGRSLNLQRATSVVLIRTSSMPSCSLTSRVVTVKVMRLPVLFLSTNTICRGGIFVHTSFAIILNPVTLWIRYMRRWVSTMRRYMHRRSYQFRLHLLASQIRTYLLLNLLVVMRDLKVLRCALLLLSRRL